MRWAAAAMGAGAGALGGYAALLLAAGLPEPGAPLAVTHPPYTWRVLVAGWWGLLLGAVALRYGAERAWSRVLAAAAASAVLAGLAVPLGAWLRHGG